MGTFSIISQGKSVSCICICIDLVGVKKPSIRLRETVSMPSSSELVKMGGFGVVVLGVELARRVTAREEEAGSDGVRDLDSCEMMLSAALALSSPSLVCCSPSWPSAIGLSFSSAVRRCRIESSISSSSKLLRLSRSMWLVFSHFESGTADSDASTSLIWKKSSRHPPSARPRPRYFVLVEGKLRVIGR